MTTQRPVVVGISGASGSVLARGVVDALLERQVPVLCTISNDARLVWQQEMEEPFTATLARWRETTGFSFHSIGEMAAPLASGTYPTRGMVIVPCSMATVAAIAHGMSTNLLQRAADVTLKEGRRLVLVPRETPLSPVHLENLLKLARLGAVVMPPEPAFYLHPRSMDDVVRFVVGRVLVALGVEGEMGEGLQYQGRDL